MIPIGEPAFHNYDRTYGPNRLWTNFAKHLKVRFGVRKYAYAYIYLGPELRAVSVRRIAATIATANSNRGKKYKTKGRAGAAAPADRDPLHRQ